jgi:HAD superfamily hydrolase (TIGR01509 family)
MTIQAMIFDLDGTLVQTEKVKALSYAKAVVELCPEEVREAAVIEVFKEVVGLSRKEVAERLIEQFNLEHSLRARMGELGVNTTWQAFVQIRLKHYDAMLADPEVLLANQWPHNIALLQAARQAGCKLGLATMSYCAQVQRVLQILDLSQAFDFVASRDDVEHGKPDPEIYRLVAAELQTSPAECLVIEDSPTGVKAALAAEMQVIAVTTPFTREAFRATSPLDRRWVVDDAHALPRVVEDLIEEHNRTMH